MLASPPKKLCKAALAMHLRLAKVEHDVAKGSGNSRIVKTSRPRQYVLNTHTDNGKKDRENYI